jgi:hypothetical protein
VLGLGNLDSFLAVLVVYVDYFQVKFRLFLDGSVTNKTLLDDFSTDFLDVV